MFALCDVLGQRHYESRYPLGARHKRNVVAYPNRTAVLAQILFLNLKLSSFSLQQLGDERPVGFAVVLMRYVQKIKCTQFLLRVTHDCLVDMIGGKKAAVQVSQRNADSRILKDGSPPLLAFPESLLGTSAVVDVYWQQVPAHDAAFLVPEGTAACGKPAVCPVGAPEAVLAFIGFARLNRPGQGGDRESKVIRVNRVAAPPVDEF